MCVRRCCSVLVLVREETGSSLAGEFAINGQYAGYVRTIDMRVLRTTEPRPADRPSFSRRASVHIYIRYIVYQLEIRYITCAKRMYYIGIYTRIDILIPGEQNNPVVIIACDIRRELAQRAKKRKTKISPLILIAS